MPSIPNFRQMPETRLSINCCFGGVLFCFVEQTNVITGFDGGDVFCASGFHVTDASICVMLLSISACGILPFDACSQM
jgi:hypothetical protein